MKKITPLLVLLLFPACLWAFDFGLALNQSAGLGGIGDETSFDYSASLIPDFSIPLGESGSLYISAGLSASYEYEEFTVVTELLHTEFSWLFNNFTLRFGRIPYADPLDFIIEGFFDGAQILYDTSAGTFNAGAWYTGLLYKKSANITMTTEDLISYYTLLKYDDFFNTYFASRRMLTALGWEHPAVAGLMRLRAAVSGQFDLNGADAPFNSMYISAKAALPLTQFVFIAGLGMQIASVADETGAGIAGELGASWSPPLAFESRLSLNWRYSSGNSGESGGVKAFVPVTTKAQGDVLEAKLSALMGFFLDYTAWLGPSVSLGLSNAYFARTDLGTYAGYPATNNTDYFLGTEFFGRFAWYPLSDLNLNLGGGVFIPSAGFETDPQWRVELGLAIILY